VYKVADVKCATFMEMGDPYQALVKKYRPLHRSQQDTAAEVERCLQSLEKEGEEEARKQVVQQMSVLLLSHRAAMCHGLCPNTGEEGSALDGTGVSVDDDGDVAAWGAELHAPVAHDSTSGGDRDDDEQDESAASLIPMLSPTPSVNLSRHSTETAPAAWHLETLLKVPAWLWSAHPDSATVQKLAMSHALSLCMQSLLPASSRCFVLTAEQADTCAMVRHYQVLVCARVMHDECGELRGPLLTMDAWDGRLLGTCVQRFDYVI
jgi:hypothetical protein